MKAPLVDYGLVFILLPCMLTGTTVGVILNKFINDLIQNILITLICIWFCYKYYVKLTDRHKVSLKSVDANIINEEGSLSEVSTEKDAFLKYK